MPERYYDEIFEYRGEWDQLSKCGLKIRDYKNKKVVIVTELYQDNPGTSVTYTGLSLARQIAEFKGLNLKDMIYIECNPDTNSKLSFYDEEFFEVDFDISGGREPEYHQLSSDEIKKYLCK